MFNFLKNKRLFELLPKNFTKKTNKKSRFLNPIKKDGTPTTLRLIAPDQEPMSYLPG